MAGYYTISSNNFSVIKTKKIINNKKQETYV